MPGPPPDFLIAGKQDSNGAMRNRRVLHPKLNALHNDCHTGFVVATKERTAIRRNQRMPMEQRQLGHGFQVDNVT